MMKKVIAIKLFLTAGALLVLWDMSLERLRTAILWTANHEHIKWVIGAQIIAAVGAAAVAVWLSHPRRLKVGASLVVLTEPFDLNGTEHVTCLLKKGTTRQVPSKKFHGGPRLGTRYIYTDEKRWEPMETRGVDAGPHRLRPIGKLAVATEGADGGRSETPDETAERISRRPLGP